MRSLCNIYVDDTELTGLFSQEGVGFAIKCGKTERSSNNYDNI